MPEKQKRNREVGEAVRDIAYLMIQEGGGRAIDGATRFERDHADLLDEFSQSLAKQRLTEMFRQAFRSSLAHLPTGQRAIPGLILARLPRLPTCINVPTDDGDTIYRSLQAATMAELAACIQARSDQLDQDTAALRDLRELHAERVEEGAEDDDPVFVPTEPLDPSAQRPGQSEVTSLPTT